MPPGGPVIVGKEAIRAFITAQFTSDAVTTELVFTSIQTDGVGDLAFDRGTYTWTGTAPGASDPVTEIGKYLVIARRQADGSWQSAVETWNSDAPPPQPE